MYNLARFRGQKRVELDPKKRVCKNLCGFFIHITSRPSQQMKLTVMACARQSRQLKLTTFDG